jgi:hypothetical protein
MTVQNVIDRIRPLISDTVATYRWSDDDLIQKINDALEELWHIRPVAFYISTIVTTRFTDVSAVGGTMPVGNDYRQALAYYVCYLCYMEDGDDSANGALAMKYFDLFEKELSR